MLYFQCYPENEDAQELLELQNQISDTIKKLRDIDKEELRVNELLTQYENIKKELQDLKKKEVILNLNSKIEKSLKA